MSTAPRLLLVTLAVALLGFVAACGGGSKTPTTPTPSSNRQPVITGVSVSPQGMGIESVTSFTFTAQDVRDPDGDTLTYLWASSDGSPVGSNGATATHVYSRSGTFNMRLTVTDSKGLSASSDVSIQVGNVTGIWDVTCESKYPSFFSSRQYLVTLSQSAAVLTGTISALGRTRSFTYPGSVKDPRRVSFGVESVDNVWISYWPGDDFYLSLTADDGLTSMTGSGQLCTSSIARRR